MSVATVVTRGYGSFGSVNKVVTRGYSVGAAIVPTGIIIGDSPWGGKITGASPWGGKIEGTSS